MESLSPMTFFTLGLLVFLVIAKIVPLVFPKVSGNEWIIIWGLGLPILFIYSFRIPIELAWQNIFNLSY